MDPKETVTVQASEYYDLLKKNQALMNKVEEQIKKYKQLWPQYKMLEQSATECIRSITSKYECMVNLGRSLTDMWTETSKINIFKKIDEALADKTKTIQIPEEEYKDLKENNLNHASDKFEILSADLAILEMITGIMKDVNKRVCDIDLEEQFFIHESCREIEIRENE